LLKTRWALWIVPLSPKEILVTLGGIIQQISILST